MTKKIFLLAFCILGGTLILIGVSIRFPLTSFYKSGSISALPSSFNSLSIGVCDIHRIKNDSKVFQKFKEVFDNRSATIHKEILEKETKLRADYEKLREQEEKAKEPTQELIKQKTELDREVAELNQIVQNRREALDEQVTKALSRIKKTLLTIMADLGHSYHLKIILNKSVGDGNQMDQSIVLFCNEGLDLTNEVINRLDQSISLSDIENLK
jgi:Skp family chaperone for outer membrane proteins